MTTFVIIRHGTCDPVGKKIAGRMSGVHLNDEGWRQAEELVSRLRNVKLNRIFTSPLERTKETASPLARWKNLAVETDDALNEINYGEWTGKSFEELSMIELWKEFNFKKSSTRIPGGEMMIEVEARICGFFEKTRRTDLGIVAVFSHGDPIKMAIAHYLGIPCDMISRFEISTASVSIMHLDDYRARFTTVNNTGRVDL